MKEENVILDKSYSFALQIMALAKEIREKLALANEIREL